MTGVIQTTTYCTKQQEYSRTYKDKIKRELVEAYGGKCKDCGHTDIRVLVIDHVNDDGAEERRSYKTRLGNYFYSILKKRGYPQDRYQLLCQNCNIIKEFERRRK